MKGQKFLKFTIRIVHNRKGMDQGNQYPVTFRFTKNRKSKFAATDIYINPKYWDEDREKVRGHHRSKYFNDEIKKKSDLIENHIFETGGDCSLQNLVDIIKKGAANPKVFSEFALLVIKNSDKSESTKRGMISRLKLFNKFRRDILLQDITENVIEDYIAHLEGKIAQTSRYKYLTDLKLILKQARKKKAIKNDPFEFVKMSTGKFKEKEKLTIDEIRTIEDSKDSIVKDLLLLLCYTGNSYTDLMQVNKNEIEFSEFKYLKSNRQKTKSKYEINISVVFNGRPDQILSKYEYRLPRKFEDGNLISNFVLNIRIQELIDGLKIDKKITSHCGRVSFISNLMRLRLEKRYVKTMTGHITGKEMVDKYNKIDRWEVDERLLEIFK